MFVINDIIWEIKYVQPKSKCLMRSDGQYSLGVTDWNTKTVCINNRLTGDKLEHVVCHELCHCICFSYNIYLPYITEEWLCNFMADYGKELIYILDDILYSMNRRLA